MAFGWTLKVISVCENVFLPDRVQRSGSKKALAPPLSGDGLGCISGEDGGGGGGAEPLGRICLEG